MALRSMKWCHGRKLFRTSSTLFRTDEVRSSSLLVQVYIYVVKWLLSGNLYYVISTDNTAGDDRRAARIHYLLTHSSGLMGGTSPIRLSLITIWTKPVRWSLTMVLLSFILNQTICWFLADVPLFIGFFDECHVISCTFGNPYTPNTILKYFFVLITTHLDENQIALLLWCTWVSGVLTLRG